MEMTLRSLLVISAIVLLGACVPLPNAPPRSQSPATPQISENQLRDKAQKSLALGVRQYEAGDYEDALKKLNAALDHGLLSKEDLSRARKYLAFIFCTSNREAQCRDEFRKALEINPRFDLSAAEAGHPIWGPVFAVERATLLEAKAAPEPAARSMTVANKGDPFLAEALEKYEAGDFDAALKLFQEAIAAGLNKAGQIRALKHSAFCLCMFSGVAQCRGEFLKIFEIEPAFDLSPAESGHPMWSKTFELSRQTFREKQARESAAKKP
jgi:tetratricopeptide (TPR) repeat protein